MNKRINDAIIKERKNLTSRQKMEIENLKKQHQKEVDVILPFNFRIDDKDMFVFQAIQKTFTDSAYDRSRLETLTKDLTATRLELEETKDRAVNLAVRLKELEVKHAETVRSDLQFF